jgi:hypothetical protein
MLPTIIATVRVFNQNYLPGSCQDFQVFEEREVEVVQLNLNSSGMRVRFTDTTYQGETKIMTQDISIDAFFAQYAITRI